MTGVCMVAVGSRGIPSQAKTSGSCLLGCRFCWKGSFILLLCWATSVFPRWGASLGEYRNGVAYRGWDRWSVLKATCRIESQKLLCWTWPLRSQSPTLKPALPTPTPDRMDCLSAKRVSTMMGEFEGGKHLYKRSMWKISGRCHELSPYNECGEGEENLCVHVTWLLFVQKHLFVWEIVSFQRGVFGVVFLLVWWLPLREQRHAMWRVVPHQGLSRGDVVHGPTKGAPWTGA